MKPAHSVVIDIEPITRAVGLAHRFRVGDRVRVQFDDGLGLEAPHALDGLVVDLFRHGRLAVRIGRMKFSVPETACTLIEKGDAP